MSERLSSPYEIIPDFKLENVWYESRQNNASELPMAMLGAFSPFIVAL
jgi:hypothetical protein